MTALTTAACLAIGSELLGDDRLDSNSLKITATLAPDASVAEEELFLWCVEELPYFALPRYIEFRGALPKTGTHRIQKSSLKREGVGPDTWDRESHKD